MNQIGIIQGRLSERPFPNLQKFPKETWEKEFEYASQIGFDYIEWILEESNYQENPLWTSEGRIKIRSRILDTGIPVNSICADYFLDNPMHKRGREELKKEVQILKQLIEYSADIGAKIILLPVLEKAEIETREEQKLLVDGLQECILKLEECDMYLGIESELPKYDYYELVKEFNSNHIGVYYDTGNCAFRGYDMKKDMEVLKNLLVCVHVKDRLFGGGSTWLGTGDTNLAEGIPYLISQKYKGDFTLQTYFEYEPIETAKKNLLIMKGLLGK